MKKRTALIAGVAAWVAVAGVAIVATASTANAVDLDWGGQFWAESHWVNRYGMDSNNNAVGRDAAREAADGYYIPYAGQKKAEFQTLFMRLQPKMIVNDNIALKSEWWFGSPNSGFFGDSGLGRSNTPGLYSSTTSGSSTVSAQRFWAEILSDFGTVVVGRAPFQWGLGLVHDAGNDLFDRFQTTGDTIRLNARFGNFTLSPATTKYVTSEVVGGTWTGSNPVTSPVGGEALVEYSLALKYENVDEDLEGGVNFVRRVAGAQGSTEWINRTAGSLNYSIWDIYARKKLGKFNFGVEAPIFSGNIVGTPYKAFAVASELNYAPSDRWMIGLKAGKVPGQPSSPTRGTSKWNMVYFHPNYKLGLIMFNYNLRNFAGVYRNTGATNPGDTGQDGASNVSIWDNPITNANYLNVSGQFRADKWRFGAQFVMATADETAVQGQNFFNQWWRGYSDEVALKSQGDSYGKEIDLSVNMDWDEFTTFGIDAGMFFPGDFFAFSNTAQDNATDSVMAIVGRIGIRF